MKHVFLSASTENPFNDPLGVGGIKIYKLTRQKESTTENFLHICEHWKIDSWFPAKNHREVQRLRTQALNGAKIGKPCWTFDYEVVHPWGTSAPSLNTWQVLPQIPTGDKVVYFELKAVGIRAQKHWRYDKKSEDHRKKSKFVPQGKRILLPPWPVSYISTMQVNRLLFLLMCL